MEPPLSLPSSTQVNPDATAAAAPPEDPPGVRSWSHGFRVRPNNELAVSCPVIPGGTLVLPTITAPAARSRATAIASCVGLSSSYSWRPDVLRIPETAHASLTVIGTPWSGPRG